MIQLPEDLAKHTHPDFGIIIRQVHAAQHAAKLYFCDCIRSGFDIAAGSQNFKPENSKTVKPFGRGRNGLLTGRCFCLFDGGVSCEFIKADRDSLTEIHRQMLLLGGNVQQPVAMAEIVIGEAGFLRAEEQRNAAFVQMIANNWCSEGKVVDLMLYFPVMERGGSYNERAVRRCFGK